MAFCNQCGAQLQDGAAFCPACGAQQGVAPQQAPQQGQPQANGGFDIKAIIENTPDFTSQMDPADINANKTMGIISYIWLLCLVPLFAAPQSKFAKFHANQGLVLAIIGTVVSIFAGILPIFLAWIFWIIDVAWFCFMIIGIMNANNGKAKELPYIGKIRILK